MNDQKEDLHYHYALKAFNLINGNQVADEVEVVLIASSHQEALEKSQNIVSRPNHVIIRIVECENPDISHSLLQDLQIKVFLKQIKALDRSS